MKRSSVTAILVGLAAAGAVRAEVPACPVPAGAAAVPFDQMPLAIQKALYGEAGNLTSPGSAAHGTGSKGLFAWNQGTRWVIATAGAGRAAAYPVYAFDVAADGKRIHPITTGRARSPAQVCNTAKAALSAH